MAELNGYQKLGIRMIIQTTRDLEKFPVQNRLYQNALDWITSNDTKHALSFVNVCDLLSYNPDYIRRKIFENPKIRKKLK